MVSPKFLVLVFRKKLDALVAKDHFVSYIKNSGFGVFDTLDVVGRCTGPSIGVIALFACWGKFAAIRLFQIISLKFEHFDVRKIN